jgi:trimeric autotransporter adhesin
MENKLFASLTLALLSTLNAELSTLYAQGTAFTYQGRLNNGANPANGSYDLTFSLFSVSSGAGQAGGTLTNSATSVSNGLFAVVLDFGANFPGADRWLEIGVRTNGSGAFATLSPRQKLTPAPYAIFAEGANGAGLTGTLPSGALSGTYGSAVTLNNAGNSFTGDGSGLANVNAAKLGGLTAASFWQLTGNAGTTPGVSFLGTPDNKALEFKVNNVRGLRIEPATNASGFIYPNVIGGYFDNLVSNGVYGATIAGGGGGTAGNTVGGNFATVGGGTANTSSDSGATVAGGYRNTSSMAYATVGGGYQNTSSDSGATVGGGWYNLATKFVATIAGGIGNTNTGNGASVGGGYYNLASNVNATVSGGAFNTAGGAYSTVGGGDYNTSGGDSATVGGGEGNSSSGYSATVPGGGANTAGGLYSFAAGYRAKALHPGSFVWADSTYADFASTADNQFLIRALGGVGLNKNNPATALDVNGTVTATSFNGNGAGMTSLNAANLTGSVPSASLTSVPAGNLTGTILDVRLSANVALLNANQTFTGSNTIAPSGSLSFGSQVRQMLNLWGTQYGIGVQSSTVYFRTDNASGLANGFAWYKGGTHNDAAQNAGGGTTMMKLDGTGLTVNGTLVSASDRNVKQDFAEVNSRAVLEKVAQLPIQTWAYKSDPNTKHLGPVAQDFYAAFAVGPDDKHIATVDESGVALAAIQGLNQKVEERDGEIQALKKAVAELKSVVKQMNEQNRGAK